MTRHILTAAVLLLLPVAASAQITTTRGGFGGGIRPVNSGVLTISPNAGPISPVMGPISPTMGPISPGAGNVFGGFAGAGRHRVFPPVWGGGWFPYYGYGYPDYYGYSGPTIVVNQGATTPVSIQPPEPVVELSGTGVATLALEFPTAAEVWVNGKKAEGETHAEWTLTSPAIGLTGDYKFDVKGRWKGADGKTYEYERSFTVASGERSKALVVSGTEVKE